jgi:hypothetical protein
VVTILSMVGVLVLLALVAGYEQHRRRPLLEATIPPGTSRAARRRIIRAERVEARRERIVYEAMHPYRRTGW